MCLARGCVDWVCRLAWLTCGAAVYGMHQVHLQLLYGPDGRLPPAVRVLTDYLTRTQLFLCNGMGNFVLRVLAFVAYVR